MKDYFSFLYVELNSDDMCWCAIPRNPPIPAETPGVPQVILTEVAKVVARAQLLARVASTLEAYGVLPYLSRSYLFFFMMGSCRDAEALLQQWGISLPSGEVTYIDARTAEMFLATGNEHETLAYSELQGSPKTAMAMIRANNRLASVARVQDPGNFTPVNE